MKFIQFRKSTEASVTCTLCSCSVQSSYNECNEGNHIFAPAQQFKGLAQTAAEVIAFGEMKELQQLE